MPITKIIYKIGSTIGKKRFDVLIPLPANHDTCMLSAGIDEFDDSDDEWYGDFNKIILHLVGDSNYTIHWQDPDNGNRGLVSDCENRDVMQLLSSNDRLKFILKSANRAIEFTHGHAIFWLNGF